MNRAERRRAKKAGIPVKKEPVVNIKAADVQKIKQDASKEAADKAFSSDAGVAGDGAS